MVIVEDFDEKEMCDQIFKHLPKDATSAILAYVNKEGIAEIFVRSTVADEISLVSYMLHNMYKKSEMSKEEFLQMIDALMEEYETEDSEPLNSMYS